MVLLDFPLLLHFMRMIVTSDKAKKYQYKSDQDETEWFMTLKTDNILIYDKHQREIALLPFDINLATYIIELHNSNIDKEFHNDY